MTRLKDITFEGGALTGTNGADSSVGSIVAATASPLKGTYYADVPNVTSAYVQEDFTATGTLYVSVYVRIDALPGTTTRFLEFRTSGSSTGPTLRFRTNGLALYDSAGAQVGTTYTMSAGDTVRVGIRYTVGTGANATCEMFIATGDNAFGAAHASKTNDTGATNPDKIRVGAPTSSALDVAFDDLRVDDAAMPGPSVASGVTGAGSAAQAADTTGAAGVVLVRGSAATMQGAQTNSGAGTVRVAGAATTTQAGDTPVAIGAVRIVGAGAATQAGDAGTATGGAPAIVGTSATAQVGDTPVAIGAVRIAGAAAAAAQAGDATSSTGAVRITGAGATTQGANTGTAAGTVGAGAPPLRGPTFVTMSSTGVMSAALATTGATSAAMGQSATTAALGSTGITSAALASTGVTSATMTNGTTSVTIA